MLRKQHYNMKEAMRKAQELLQNGDDDDGGEGAEGDGDEEEEEDGDEEEGEEENGETFNMDQDEVKTA